MILNIYKEKGWTSFDVVAKIRGMLRAKRGIKNVKVGHAGTLDPLAEGVLIVLTDADTKKQDFLMGTDKEYVCEVEFGKVSETYDLDGTIHEVSTPESFDLAKQLPEVLPKFIGEISQRVPPYSAVKVNGSPLYRSARKGTLDEKKVPTKTVCIYEIELLETNRLIARIRVRCGKGTYIRSFAHDLGKELGTGALLRNLLRTRVGDYALKESIKIEDLKM